MANTALVQVLGAVTYGEWKAYEGAKEKALAATSEQEKREWQKIAAEELRHYEGFSARLRALGADPERAMRPFRRALDLYHSGHASSPVAEVIWLYFGEGIADDLLVWLRTVVDSETAAFVDTVLAEEEEHEDRAVRELKSKLSSDAAQRRAAARATRRMLERMMASGRKSALPLTAFLKIGQPFVLVRAIVRGYTRRLQAIGLLPFGSAPSAG